ncbi:cytochrome P450 [Aspergillus saccharolyticus JOP 1030-1]|uniref:Putative cytochrome P450 monooxygenase n=1 Tax=Aspergillus saccharolyticus JOP 1030-1 TaxID=1450539 RepID=A0A318ZE21_9EURO|nr:putative cytochrome P450 monooxygenase [Aspergillus saccharolyticus JOP 1030-1]PYH45776.1 putative cytochrome P450 monooxygenase [Aspergillus saccharolyticus JOP 1030-1]
MGGINFPFSPSIALIICLVICYFALVHHNEIDPLPTVRYKWFLPDLINRVMFYFNARNQIAHGYEKYKDRAFRLLTADGDLVVLPLKWLWEIEHLPITKLSAIRARHKNFLGEYTDLFKGSTNVSCAVTGMDRRNQHIAGQFNEEFHKALCRVVPRCQYKWTSANLYRLVLKLISRATARFTVGEELCLNDLWLETVTAYTTDILTTIILLRPVPRFLRAPIAWLLPSLRRARTKAHWAQTELLVPRIELRRHRELTDSTYKKPEDLMQWVMDTAETNYDRDPTNIAKALMSTIALLIVYPITNVVTHAVYDTLTQPETLGPLRTEIETIMTFNEQEDAWDLKSNRPYQYLMDSFLRESLRWNPLSERKSSTKVFLSHQQARNLTLPPNTQICFPAGPLSRDPTIIPNAHRFDSFRWTHDPFAVWNLVSPDTIDTRLRNAVAFNSGLTDISPVNLHFGWGHRHAAASCPGRHLASRMVAVALSHLLIQYDLRFFPGERKRPANLGVGEFVLPNPGTRVLIRERARGG